jgi:hypothetical protein
MVFALMASQLFWDIWVSVVAGDYEDTVFWEVISRNLLHKTNDWKDFDTSNLEGPQCEHFLPWNP